MPGSSTGNSWLCKELFDQLDSEVKPFPKRFKLAQNAYYATGGSSERILSWICSSLKEIANTDFGQFLTEWEKLVTSVHSQHVRLLVKLMFESVLEHLQSNGKFIQEYTFDHIIDLLDNSRVQNYFFTDLESYISLVEALLSTLATRQRSTDHHVCKRLFNSMESFARMMSLREFPAFFLDQLFLPSVHLVNSTDSDRMSLQQQLILCIDKAVFFKNTASMTTFLDSLMRSKKSKSSQGQGVVNETQKPQHCYKPGLKLLEKLHHVLNIDSKDALLTYNILFKCLMKSNHPNVISLKMLITICPILGIHVSNAKLKVELPEELLNNCRTAPDELSLSVLESVLSIILNEGIGLPDDNEFQCVNWIECLWRVLLSLPIKVRQNGAYLRCLTTLLQLHPRAVLNRKLPIITDVLVILAPDKDLPEFVTFLHVVLSIHQKRFTVHELLTSLFTNSKQLLNTRKRLDTGVLGVDCFVPPSFYAEIQKYSADWPSGPILEFTDFMLTQLQTLAFLADNLRNIYTDVAAAIGVRLLCAVLTGTRIVDHCNNEKTRSSYVTRFKSMSQLLKQMARVAQTSENQVYIRAFLELEYTWASVLSMLQHYCPEAVLPLSESVPTSDEEKKSIKNSFALTFLHKHIALDVWESIRAKINSGNDLATQQLLLRLEMQTLRFSIISNQGSLSEASAVAEFILPQLVSYVDVESMVNDIHVMGNLLGKNELKQLTEKLVDLLLSSGDKDPKETFRKSFERLQENRSLICGVSYSLLERLLAVCSTNENDWPTVRKVSAKLTSSEFEKMADYTGEEWGDVLTSMGKALNKALKKIGGPPETSVAELSQISEILQYLKLQPVEYLPENLQTAVITVLLALSVDLLPVEESEEISLVYNLIYHQLIWGVLERWPVTTEAPPLQKYLDISLVTSHVVAVTKLKSPVDISIVHVMLGLSVRSLKSLNKVLEAFFAQEQASEEAFVIRQELLSIICKDSLSAECRKILRSADSERIVVSSLSSYIQAERPRKQLLQTYTLLICRALQRKEKLENVVPHLEAYCQLAVKGLHKTGSSRRIAENFVCGILKYHECQTYLPANFVEEVWTVLREVDQPSSDIASLLFSCANKRVLGSMIHSLMKELENTTDELSANSNVLLLLEALIKSPLISEFSQEKRQNCVMNFLSQQHVFSIYPPLTLLKVLSSIIETSKVVVQVHMADAIFLAVSSVTSRGIRNDMAVLSMWFRVLNGMLFHRNSQTMDCLPAFTAELRLLIQAIVQCSRQNQLLEKSVFIAQGVEKMFQTIVKVKMSRNFIRVGAYILADLLKHFEGQLPQPIKVILENVVCDILGFLDTYAQRFLGKVVNAESAEILKEIGRIRALRRSKIV